MSAFIDLSGKTFDRLTVIDLHSKNPTRFNCHCSCGNNAVVRSYSLLIGDTRSCGCIHTETMTTHGVSGTTEYKIWHGIVDRCTNLDCCNFINYGARGITVCDRWKNSVKNFIEDMGKRPSVNHSIERINNSAGYSPDNCCWATNTQQCNNKRNNRNITFNGETLTIAQWARKLGIHHATLSSRLNNPNWPLEKALFHPVTHD